MIPRVRLFRSFPAAIFGAALALAGCGAGDGRTRLTIYSPHGPELLQPVEAEYERLHPDVDVQWLFMGSQEVYERVRAETANPQGDVWFGGPASILAVRRTSWRTSRSSARARVPSGWKGPAR